MRSNSILSLFVLLSVILSGCLNEEDKDAVYDQPTNSVVIYAARSEALIGPLLEKFSNQSGIEVQVRYGGTSQLAASLFEEGANSPADVFYTRDPGGLIAISELLSLLPPDLLETVPEWARPLEGNWIGTSARARVVIYNTNLISEADLPDSLKGFTDPKWRSSIAWSPSSGPTQSMVTAMRIVWGEKKTMAWLEGIKANDAKTYPNHTAIVASVGTGETTVGFVNHYYLLRFLEERGGDFPVRNYHLRESDPGNLIMVVGAGILANGGHRENAEVFLRFLLSTEAQDYLTNHAFDYPVIDLVTTNIGLKPLSEIKNPKINQSLLGGIKATEALMREVGIIP